MNEINEIEISRLQHEVGVWSRRNFPVTGQPHVPLIGAMEELGELAVASQDDDPHVVELVKALGRLAHAHIKMEQGIRGTDEKHKAAKEDAVADIVIYLADYCERNGIKMGWAVSLTWENVRRRDWQKNKEDGLVGGWR